MIEVHGLTKSYGTARVVDDVSFSCEPGTITGFLGPNGAGKSTTLRMMTGLTTPDAGYALVDGRPYVEIPNPAGRVGTLLDASAFNPGRSGHATLSRSAEMVGADAKRVDELLAKVGLTGADPSRRVADYSLGMKQRLGIAQALVGDPSVLILDEPANGLDPEGIRWMRLLLRDFAERGGTVLLSSHLLAEVEATVDRLVVIRGGRVVAAGALEELTSTSGVVARAEDGAALEAMLYQGRIAYTRRDDGALNVEAEAEQVARLGMDSGVLIVELRKADSAGLEQLFFSLTQEQEVAA